MELTRTNRTRATLSDPAFWRIMMPLALPIALQNLLMTSFRLVDTLMIGRLGDVSIAAVGLASYASFFVELVTFGVASGSAVFLAQYHGAGNIRGIRRTMGVMLVSVVPIGVVLSVVTMVWPEAVMRLFTDDLVLIEEGVRYLRFAALSYVSLTLNTALGTILRCTEVVKAPMWISGFCALLNAGLNYLFIFGGLGVAAMGVAGAGLATAISSLASPLLLLAVSVVQRNALIAPIKDLLDIGGFLGTYWKRVFPVLLNEMIWSLSIIGINMVFGRMGTDNYAALTVERTIENIVFVFFVGICNACNVIVGKCIGAGQIEQGKRYAVQFLQLVPALGVVLGGLVVLLRGPMIALFDISEAAQRTAGIILLIYAIDVSIRNVPYLTVVGIFRAGGDTKRGLLCDGLVQYLLVLPAVILCAFVFKLSFLTTYVVMILVDDCGKLCFTVPYFISMKWIKPVQQEGFNAELGASQDPAQARLDG